MKCLAGPTSVRFGKNRLDDADIVIVAMGSLAMEAIVAADMLRRRRP